MNELSQLDELIESDVLEALGQDVQKDANEADTSTKEDEILIEDFEEEVPASTTEQNDDEEILIEDIESETDDEIDDEIDILEGYSEEPLPESEEENEDLKEDKTVVTQEVSIPNVNTTDLASLLSQLLNNKTIEITIKIKD
jgi:hypothetical protein